MLQLERDSLNDINNGIPRDWVKHLCRLLQEDLHKFRAYKTESVRDLLRAIRLEIVFVNSKHKIKCGVKRLHQRFPNWEARIFSQLFKSD